MRSGSETRQMTTVVTVRLMPDDADKLREKADRQGITISRLLREIALNEVGEVGIAS